MTLWFGPYVELEPGHGYFHLCQPCYRETVAPHIEDVADTLARLHPAAAAYLEREREADTGRVVIGSYGSAEPAPNESDEADESLEPGPSGEPGEPGQSAEPNEPGESDATRESA